MLKYVLVAAALLVSGSAFAFDDPMFWTPVPQPGAKVITPAPIPVPTSAPKPAPTPNSLGQLSGTLYAYTFTFSGLGSCTPTNCPAWSPQNVPGLVIGDIVLWMAQQNPNTGVWTSNTMNECQPLVIAANALACNPNFGGPSWQQKVIVLRPTAPIAPGW